MIKIPAKYDRCVRKVKRQKSARNPYAVCSYLRAKKVTKKERKKSAFGWYKSRKTGRWYKVNAKGKRKTSIEEDILSWGEIVGFSLFAKGKKRKK